MSLHFTVGPTLVLALALSTDLSRQTPIQQARNDEAVTTAIEHIRNLEYAESKEQLRHFLAAHSTNLRAWNYLAIAVLYEEMFKRGVLESRVYGQGGDVFKPSKVAVTPEFQQELLGTLDKAQAVAEDRLKSDNSDQEAMYWAGVTHGTRATYHFALRKEYKPALHEATEAYNYHRGLLKQNPNYVDAYLIVGMNNYVVGSLPWYIKVLAALTGRHGNRAQGLQQMKRAEQEGHYAREDARLMLAVVYQRENERSERGFKRNCNKFVVGRSEAVSSAVDASGGRPAVQEMVSFCDSCFCSPPNTPPSSEDMRYACPQLPQGTESSA